MYGEMKMGKYKLSTFEIRALKNLSKKGFIKKNEFINAVLINDLSKNDEVLLDLIQTDLIVEKNNQYMLSRKGAEFLWDRKKWFLTTIIAILAAFGTVGTLIVSIIKLFIC